LIDLVVSLTVAQDKLVLLFSVRLCEVYSKWVVFTHYLYVLVSVDALIFYLGIILLLVLVSRMLLTDSYQSKFFVVDKDILNTFEHPILISICVLDNVFSEHCWTKEF
jgi:hypothetical protein